MADVAEFIQCDARNYTPGRRGCGISNVVVHYASTGASAHDNLLYFSRSDAKASAHYFIDKDGTLRQSVREGDTAWHAGNWEVNLRSVGVEVVSAGEDFTEAQVATLASLVADLRARYGIGAGDVIRHYDVTGKLCPAPYVDAGKWAALHARICGGAAPATGGGASAPSGDVADLARRVIAGEFGNGDARRTALGDRYQEVQAEVNRMLGAESAPSAPAPAVDVDELARRTISGEFGNGDARRAALGTDYAAVQARVNEMLGCGGGSGDAVDVDSLAQAVINGDYGNGEERKRRLGANYAAVQMRVNEILS
ncbi:MAG: N-acetylmuramoyl-L-alanine amidase [Atopobiaceae bacterium]|jgi:hypothetical protein|nr:N-acetylmuramoyl-L-alanine amidase [Atopobiaceae bacterium]MCH4213696.1 N-acetylmuramoyl-L-alanine amidase [Atopobiaceae bacterium]MCH4275947.1 N-acetylmuramoyl-L-alanine amidase [Atopobiaceae bacterium]MCI1225704.1 N-acetylmuramoyl-L-alanine amidase [Atopobiaceae bacterium]MCI1260350.1 N-acetylmuramoyl-L-alanine amidase [Atopobiaceae bacterium]